MFRRTRTITVILSVALTLATMAALWPGAADARISRAGISWASQTYSDGTRMTQAPAFWYSDSTFNSWSSSSSLGYDKVKPVRWNGWGPQRATRMLFSGWVSDTYRVTPEHVAEFGRPTHLVVRARGNYCGGGWTSMNVTVDGRPAINLPVNRRANGDVITRPSTGQASEYTEYFTNRSMNPALIDYLGDGRSHTINVAMVNPHATSSCKRVLRVDYIAVQSGSVV